MEEYGVIGRIGRIPRTLLTVTSFKQLSMSL